MLKYKNIILGVTGSIAAYKALELTRLLRAAGAEVQVVMTDGAKQFITPLSFQAISGRPVRDSLWDTESEAAMDHISLARWADLILIAPASAHCIAKLAHGYADDLLQTLCLATQANVKVAPAMNQQMWLNAQTCANVNLLRQRDVAFLGPASGEQACGEVGPGRMLEPDAIVQQLTLSGGQPLAGQHLLITAGPTREFIDPVRFLSNPSSGKMGYALANAAINAGARVTLITGPTHLQPPKAAETHHVTTAAEMYQAVMAEIETADVFMATAAVSDYTPTTPAQQKLKKTGAPLTLSLSGTQDILMRVSELDNPPFLVGFAAETENMIENAKRKQAKKHIDIMIANHVATPGIGFESDDNAVTVLWGDQQKEWGPQSKIQLAERLIALVAETMSVCVT